MWLTPDLKALLAAQVNRVKLLSRKLDCVLPYLFTHLRGCHKGKPLGDFRKVWRDATRQPARWDP